MFLYLKTDYLICGFSTTVTCAFLALETMEKLTELNTFEARKTTFSSTLLIRLRFKGYCCGLGMPPFLNGWSRDTLNIIKTLIELHDTLIEFYETLIEFHETLIEFYETLIDFHETLIEFHKKLIEFHETLIEFHETLIEFHKTLIEFHKKLIEFHETLIEFQKN